MDAGPEEIVRRHLFRHGGAAPRSEFLAAGVTDSELRRLLASGCLVHRHRCYALAHGHAHPPEVTTAVRGHPGSAASHFTAATAHKLTVWVDQKRHGRPPADSVWLTRPRGVGRSVLSSGLVVRRAALSDKDVGLVARMRCMTPARTAVELARELPLCEAVAVLDSALSARIPRSDLAAVLDRQTGWPGSVGAATALSLSDGLAESPLESVARLLFLDAGIPAAVLQAQLFDGRHWSAYRVDFCWPDGWVIAEVDGLAKYEADTAAKRRVLRRRDYERENRIIALGFEIVRFGWEDVLLRPDEVVGRLLAALHRGRSRHPKAAVVRPAYDLPL